jgi:hypothetical protein
MKRYKYNLSHTNLLTGEMGELLPIGCVPVLPGDTFQQQSTVFIRLTPQTAPIMHQCDVRVHSFYVENRNLWDGWEDFITGEDTSTPIPTLTRSSALPIYLGSHTDTNKEFSALPIRGYNSIFNEYYRDQDLVSEVAETNQDVLRVAWEKDYFTAARPWETKGDDVTLTLGSEAPIRGMGITDQGSSDTISNVRESGDDSGDHEYDGWEVKDRDDTANAGETHLAIEESDTSGYPHIYADLSDADAININDLRRAFGLQRFQEARSRYGSRYSEFLQYAFGVRPKDLRLDKPLYLGGGKARISFSEVLQTGVDSSNEGVGSMSGHGVAALRTRKWRKYFDEHGYVITLLSVRPKAIYSPTGSHRDWHKTEFTDFYNQELALIGQQPVYNRELYIDNTSADDEIFGYSDRYSEYRSHPSRIAGEFRTSPKYEWHLARIFSTRPALNESFIECDPTKRGFQDQTVDAMQIQAYNHIAARRVVTPQRIGRII